MSSLHSAFSCPYRIRLRMPNLLSVAILAWEGPLRKQGPIHSPKDLFRLFFSLRRLFLFLPTVLRAPPPATEPRDGPTRNFQEKYRKNTPWPEILDSRNLPRKYPENTEKIPQKYQKSSFWYFFGIFGVFSWGSKISAWDLFFRYFWWKFRVGPSRGSVAGRGILNNSVHTRCIVKTPGFTRGVCKNRGFYQI